MPPGFDFIIAAAGSVAYQTAWRIGYAQKLQKGEDILILGGSGGVAVAAIQISKMLGARVFVITSSDEKIEKARLAGADFATNRKTSNPFKEVSRRTTNRGVDLVVENVGALTRGQSQNIARKGGRLVTYGRTTGREAITNISTLFWNEQTLIGSTMGRIARHLKGSPQTVAYWVTDVAEAAPNAPLPNEVKEAEMDEMFTFLGDQKTKSIWLL